MLTFCPCAHRPLTLHTPCQIKPTVLIGVSTVAGAFSEDVLRAMAELNPRPIIMPLSNPTSKSECTFEAAVAATRGRVLFASGSPFPPCSHGGRTLYPAQVGNTCGQGISFPAEAPALVCLRAPGPLPKIIPLLRSPQANNAYIFPAVGHAAVLTRCKEIRQALGGTDAGSSPPAFLPACSDSSARNSLPLHSLHSHVATLSRLRPHNPSLPAFTAAATTSSWQLPRPWPPCPAWRSWSRATSSRPLPASRRCRHTSSPRWQTSWCVRRPPAVLIGWARPEKLVAMLGQSPSSWHSRARWEAACCVEAWLPPAPQGRHRPPLPPRALSSAPSVL